MKTYETIQAQLLIKLVKVLIYDIYRMGPYCQVHNDNI